MSDNARLVSRFGGMIRRKLSKMFSSPTSSEKKAISKNSVFDSCVKPGCEPLVALLGALNHRMRYYNPRGKMDDEDEERGDLTHVDTELSQVSINCVFPIVPAFHASKNMPLCPFVSIFSVPLEKAGVGLQMMFNNMTGAEILEVAGSDEESVISAATGSATKRSEGIEDTSKSSSVDIAFQTNIRCGDLYEFDVRFYHMTQVEKKADCLASAKKSGDSIRFFACRVYAPHARAVSQSRCSISVVRMCKSEIEDIAEDDRFDDDKFALDIFFGLRSERNDDGADVGAIGIVCTKCGLLFPLERGTSTSTAKLPCPNCERRLRVDGIFESLDKCRLKIAAEDDGGGEDDFGDETKDGNRSLFFSVGSRVRALWLGSDHERHTDWYRGTVTELFYDVENDGEDDCSERTYFVTIQFDDMSTSKSVPVKQAVRESLDHMVNIFNKTYPDMPKAAIKQCVREASRKGQSESDVVREVENLATSCSIAKHQSLESYCGDNSRRNRRRRRVIDPRWKTRLGKVRDPSQEKNIGSSDVETEPIVKFPTDMRSLRFRRFEILAARSLLPRDEWFDRAFESEMDDEDDPTTAKFEETKALTSKERLESVGTMRASAITPTPSLEDEVAGNEAEKIEEDTGLSTEQMFNLMSARCDESETTLEDPCVVCMCEIRKGEKVLALECGHSFHVGCIEKWLEARGKCPVCQTNVEI
eukprot:g1939.t1